MKLSIELPEKLDISDRSRMFWEDGYKFDDDGFTDEDDGKSLRAIFYRAFDCYDDNARAPTPLPPIFLMQCMKEDEEQEILEETPTPASKQSAAATPASDQVRTSSRLSRKSNKSTTVPVQESSSSPLSDCPSDLSDWDLSSKTKNSTTTDIKEDKEKTEETKAETPTPSKTKTPAKRNTTTRGVAQKVKKQPAKKGKAAAAAPVVLERNTSGGAARKRSGH